jgi:hypothetical protein
MASTTLIAPAERRAPSATPHPRRTYTCPECGHVLHVSGLGRHAEAEAGLEAGV